MRSRRGLSTRIQLSLALALCVCAPRAFADGAIPAAQGLVGGFDVTLLYAPHPPRVGASEWTVVIRRPTGEVPLPLPPAEIVFSPVDGGAALPIEAALRAHPTQPGLLIARVDLSAAGPWRVQLQVGPPEARDALPPFVVEVEPEGGVLVRHWPALAVAPVGLALWMTRQRLVSRLRSTR